MISMCKSPKKPQRKPKPSAIELSGSNESAASLSFNFKSASLFGLVAFGLLYIYLFFIIQYISHKIKINSYTEFNKIIFGRLCKFSNVVMLINFSITCAGMLAGADYLFEQFFNIGFKIPSIILSVITFLLLLGGIDKIKFVANLIIPILIAVIVVNSIANITPENVHFEITTNQSVMAIYYGLLFGVNNFVAALPVLFETRLKSKGKICVIVSICIIILLFLLGFWWQQFGLYVAHCSPQIVTRFGVQACKVAQ